MGRTLRAEHEVCPVASRGRPRPLRLSTRTTFEDTCLGHSRKPGAFYKLVETTFPAPRVELFARWRRDGWLQFGNELPDAAPDIATVFGSPPPKNRTPSESPAPSDETPARAG